MTGIKETIEVITNAGYSPHELKKIILEVYNKLPNQLREEIYNYFLELSYDKNSVQFGLYTDSGIKETIDGTLDLPANQCSNPSRLLNGQSPSRRPVESNQ